MGGILHNFIVKFTGYKKMINDTNELKSYKCLDIHFYCEELFNHPPVKCSIFRTQFELPLLKTSNF